MKRYDSIGQIGHIFETDQQVVTDLVIPEHHVDYTVVVVPIKGKIIFSGHDFETELAPGSFVRMLPNESHSLKAIEDSELFVIKSKLEK
ncbi:cupin [Ligilactobacillus ruminis]|uniref:cupin n=1 Tax=Ligilactobacillus ruminis TaxID=1623 RepID=UPI001C0257AE|nr:cupin [Ligilactobacillus ruminis]MBT9626695.1 cupin [Ligilactobacillus ruminis]